MTEPACQTDRASRQLFATLFLGRPHKGAGLFFVKPHSNFHYNKNQETTDGHQMNTDEALKLIRYSYGKEKPISVHLCSSVVPTFVTLQSMDPVSDSQPSSSGSTA